MKANAALLQNGLYIYSYLAKYGYDKYATKRDLMLLFFLNDILEENCHYDVLNECAHRKVLKLITNILNRNPQLKYCKKEFFDYKNLGGPQNIDTYKLLPEEDCGINLNECN